MGSRVKNLTRSDFDKRITRINRAHTFGGAPAKARRGHPVIAALVGFIWFYVVANIALRKSEIAASLSAGSIPADKHMIIFSALAALVVVSAVVLLACLVRCLARTRARGTSGGLVIGGLAAIALVATPPETFEAGLGLLDDNTQTLLSSARASVSGIDWGEVTMLSSN